MIGSIQNLKWGFMTLKNSLEFNKTWLSEHNNISWNLFHISWSFLVVSTENTLYFNLPKGEEDFILNSDKSRFQVWTFFILTIPLNTVLKFRGQTQTQIPSCWGNFGDKWSLVDTCQGRVANAGPCSRWPGLMPGSKVSGWVGWWHAVSHISQYLTTITGTRTALYSPHGNCGPRLCYLFPAHRSITDTMRSWRYEEHSSFLNSNIPEQNFRKFVFSESDHSILLNEPLHISADWQRVHCPRLPAWSSGYPHKNIRTQGSCPDSRLPTPGTGPGHSLAFTNITIPYKDFIMHKSTPDTRHPFPSLS